MSEAERCEVCKKEGPTHNGIAGLNVYPINIGSQYRENWFKFIRCCDDCKWKDHRMHPETGEILPYVYLKPNKKASILDD
jgi:hypothetical protein